MAGGAVGMAETKGSARSARVLAGFLGPYEAGEAEKDSHCFEPPHVSAQQHTHTHISPFPNTTHSFFFACLLLPHASQRKGQWCFIFCFLRSTSNCQNSKFQLFISEGESGAHFVSSCRTPALSLARARSVQARTRTRIFLMRDG